MRPTHHESGATERRGILFAARLLTAASILCLPLLAGTESGPGTGRSGAPGNGSPGSTVAGDETIGTLPAYGPDVPFDLVRYFMDAQANLVLQGNRFDVLSSILGVRGPTVATIQVLDVATDTVRYTFHGSPQIALDPAMLASGLVRVGIRVPRTYGEAEAKLALGGRTMATTDLAPGVQLLPLVELTASGALERRTFTADAGNLTGLQTRIAARLARGVVLLEQTH